MNIPPKTFRRHPEQALDEVLVMNLYCSREYLEAFGAQYPVYRLGENCYARDGSLFNECASFEFMGGLPFAPAFVKYVHALRKGLVKKADGDLTVDYRKARRLLPIWKRVSNNLSESRAARESSNFPLSRQPALPKMVKEAEARREEASLHAHLLGQAAPTPLAQ